MIVAPTSSVLHKGYLVPVAIKFQIFRAMGYKPFDKQRKAHIQACKTRNIIIAGGARFGKSIWAAAEVTVELMFPARHIWLVGTQYELSEKEFVHVLTFLSRIKIGNRKLIDLCKVTMSSRGKRVCKMPWGSILETKSTEKPTSLLGESLTSAVLCEGSQHNREPYERFLKMRLSDRDGRLLGTSTGNGDQGLFYDLFKLGQKKSEPLWWSIQGSTYDNPTVPTDFLENAKREMHDDVYREQVLGEFVSRFGKPFTMTDAHWYDDSELPVGWEHWPILRSIVGRNNNNHAIAWVIVDPNTYQIYVHDEYYANSPSVNDIATEMQTRHQGKRHLISLGCRFNPLLNDQLRRKRIFLSENTDKFDRKQDMIKRVQLLQNLTKVQSNGYPKLRFSRRCVELYRDFKDITWKAPNKDKFRQDSELPLDLYWTGPDCVSQICQYIDNMKAGGIS